MLFLLNIVLGLLIGAIVLILTLIVAVSLPVSVLLLGVLLLQLLGVLKGVPFSYNLRNLVVRWIPTLLTAVAFTVVVALMTGMGAFVNGMYRLTQNSGVASNVIVMADGSTDELFSNLGFGDVKEIALRDEVLKDDGGERLASWEVYVVVNQPIPTRKCPVCREMARVDDIGEKLLPHGEPECAGSGTRVVGTRGRRFIQVRGVEDPVISGKVHNLTLASGGSWFSQAGVQGAAGRQQGRAGDPGGDRRGAGARAGARPGKTHPGGRRSLRPGASQVGDRWDPAVVGIDV